MGQIANTKYQRTRSLLLHRGMSLRAWAIGHGYRVGTVYNSVKGTRNGAVAVSIRSRLNNYLNEK